MTVDIEKFTPEELESYERLCLFHHVHQCNSEMLDHAIALSDNLTENPGKTLSNEMLTDWVEAAGFVMQTIDALMHLLQRNHVGPFLEVVKTLSKEDQEYIRDNLNTPEVTRMLAILSEDDSERAQRILLEHLDIHE